MTPAPAAPSGPELPDPTTWRRWGIDPAWSRLVDVPANDDQGSRDAPSTHRWHLLDTGPPTVGSRNAAPPEKAATIVCVHGNPTWAYAWKPLLTRFAGRHRIIAMDQLSMGYSERVPARGYAQRVLDLDALIDALHIEEGMPLILAAHDWGGAIALGWAVDHAEQVDGVVLGNTGIAVPEGRRAPGIIRLAASTPLRDLVCRRTSAFVEGTVRLAGSRMAAIDREAFRAPYRRAEHRQAIETFVGDVPLASPHPSEKPLADVAAKLGTIGAPVLLAWGAKDIVFDDDFAADLAERLPNTQLQRYPAANHLVVHEADVAGAVDTWLGDLLAPNQRARYALNGSMPLGSLFTGLERRRGSDDIAVSDLASGDSIDFAAFVARVDAVAAALKQRGLQPGHRVAMLTPPGIDLIVAVYAVWRAGGVTVIADRGLGLRGLGAAVRATRPAWSIGPRAARIVSAVMRWAPRATHIDVAELMHDARNGAHPPQNRPPNTPGFDDEAAILFTSGATGPAKGVRYLHRQLAAQRDALATAYGITADDRLVAAFAPFALYGPALGVPTALADSDVTKPGKLTAGALDDACRAVSATMVFASPAALANVVRTAPGTGSLPGIAALRLMFSAGAPVPAEILRQVASLAPLASLHTPYGMTEVLPVADIDLSGIEAADEAETAAGGVGGVCVGQPVSGCEIMIAPLEFDASTIGLESVPIGRTGEILVRAPWVSQGYLGRWHTQRLARPGDGWHRTGDVGHRDVDGRLWVEGRMVHVLDTVDGPVTSVPIERAVERKLVRLSLATAGRVAAVGVGPRRCQQIVVVIEGPADAPADGLADTATSAAVRDAVGHPVAAVLTMAQLPVDIRHNAKIDRAAVARWGAGLLAGGRRR